MRCSCPTKFRSNLLAEFRNFKSQLNNKWLRHNRHKERFLSSETAWLNGYCDFTKYSIPKGGRPELPFEECSDNSKRRKTAHLRSEMEADVLVYAAQMNLRASGKVNEAEVINKVMKSPEYSKDCLHISSTTKAKRLSSRQALSLIIEAQLSRKQYETVRNYAPDIFPSYKLVQAEKISSYPKNVQVTETEAIVPLQSLLNHTATRLVQAQKNVLDGQSLDESDTLVLLSKWGFDGSSSHTQYKQKFISEIADDKYMFLTSLVPLRLIYSKNDKTYTLWQNSKPSSPRFCRPISLQYLKETDELVKRKKEGLDKEIELLVPTQIIMDGKKYSVEHRLVLTMIDGKLCNSLSDNKSTMKCYLCDATSKQFNDLDTIVKRPIKTDYLSFGISVLHSWIRLFESLLHLSYRLPIRTWRVDKKNKEALEENKKRIQAEFKNRLSLIIDKPKPGFGNSNDGNVARKFFQNFQISAEITQIDQNLIRKFYIILQTMSSGFQINSEKFKKYCLETAVLYTTLYSWMPMTPTMHKILIHGSNIINEALLPIGMLSEEAQEARNKDFKFYREHFGRKTSRIDNLTDIINRLFVSSDPLISQMRNMPTVNKKSFNSEVIQMLEDCT